VPQLFNLIQNLTIAKKITKLEGCLPQLQSIKLSKWWETQKPVNSKYNLTVWVLCDIYTEYYDTQAGKDLLSFLKSCKVNIELINLDTSIIALISKGLLNEAKHALNRYYAKLSDISKQDLIVGIDPSEALVWRDDAKCLVEKTLQVNLFEEMVIKLNKSNLLPVLTPLNKKVCIHLHCHQKSLVDKQVTIDALSLIPKLKIEVLNVGCCGAAGDFGYKNSGLSNNIFWQSFRDVTRKEIDKKEIVITGFSCKIKIRNSGIYSSINIKSLPRVFLNCQK
jgi:Fe-S oxidoreductase